MLRNVTKGMSKTPGSKLVINEVLNTSPTISAGTTENAAHPPSNFVPKNQSRLPELANLMTWNTYFMFGGKERSYAEIEDMLQQSGLKITRFFPFRTLTVMIEAEVA